MRICARIGRVEDQVKVPGEVTPREWGVVPPVVVNLPQQSFRIERERIRGSQRETAFGGDSDAV